MASAGSLAVRAVDREAAGRGEVRRRRGRSDVRLGRQIVVAEEEATDVVRQAAALLRAMDRPGIQATVLLIEGVRPGLCPPTPRPEGRCSAGRRRPPPYRPCPRLDTEASLPIDERLDDPTMTCPAQGVETVGELPEASGEGEASLEVESDVGPVG